MMQNVYEKICPGLVSGTHTVQKGVWRCCSACFQLQHAQLSLSPAVKKPRAPSQSYRVLNSVRSQFSFSASVHLTDVLLWQSRFVIGSGSVWLRTTAANKVEAEMKATVFITTMVSDRQQVGHQLHLTLVTRPHFSIFWHIELCNRLSLDELRSGTLESCFCFQETNNYTHTHSCALCASWCFSISEPQASFDFLVSDVDHHRGSVCWEPAADPILFHIGHRFFFTTGSRNRWFSLLSFLTNDNFKGAIVFHWGVW